MKRTMFAFSIALLALVFVGCPNPAATTTETPKSSNADLSALVVDSGTLSPAFTAGTLAYTVSVANSVTTVTVTGTKADATASLPAPVVLSNLVVGVPQTAEIKVTAQNGTVKVYTVTVTRQAAPTVPLTGILQDYKTGTAINGATITSNSQTATTGSDGKFSIGIAFASGRGVVNITKDGYADASRIILENSSLDQLTVLMLPVSQNFSFSGATAQILAVSGSTASVSLPANSLQTASGSAASGTVTADVTVINPLSAPETMPGDFSTSSASSIESFGAMNVILKDSTGAALNLASGTTSTIRIPVPAGSVSPPASIPLFYYNTTTGAWVEEGSATLAGSSPNQYYQGTVAHFSTWNCDRVYDRVTIKGFVKDLSGNPVAQATVTATGQSYNGSNSAVTLTDGSFTVYGKASSTLLLKASKSSRSSNTVSITTGSSGSTYTLPSALIITDQANATIRLTWGSTPSDLDSHLSGPITGSTSRFHVYFSSKGSLSASPYASLDVDDTSSYGPEVITITSFIPGTYRYSIKNYSSGTPTIYGSPTRIELNLNGSTQVFTPPSGSTTGSGELWTVFELVVPASGGTPTVTTINTISHTTSPTYNMIPRGDFVEKPPLTAEELAQF